MKIKDAKVLLHTSLGNGEKFDHFSMGERFYIGGKEPWIGISGWHRLVDDLNARKFLLIGTRIIRTDSIVDVELIEEAEREVLDD